MEAHSVVANQTVTVPSTVSERADERKTGITYSFSNLFTRSHLSPTINDVNRESCASAAMIDTIATCRHVKKRI